MERLVFVLSNGSLRINGQLVQLDYPVNKALTINNMVIACLDIPQGVIYNRNIVAIDENLKIIWQIEASPHGTQSDKPFMNIWITKEGDLVAGNWIGVDYKVNVNNGNITPLSLTK